MKLEGIVEAIAFLCVLYLASAIVLAQSLNPYPLSPDIQSYVALCKAIYWQNMGDYQEVKKQLGEAIQFDPGSSFLYAKLAEVLISMKDFGGAIYASRKSLERDPRNTDAHYLLGILNLARQDRQGAVDEFKIVAELNPDHVRAQYNLSSLMFEQEDYKGAARAYSEMVRLRPYDPKLRFRLGLSYSRSGEAEKAIREFNAAVKLGDDYLEPHFHLAYLYARQSRNREAIAECLIVLKSAPRDTSMNLLLSELYVAMGEFDEAIPGAKEVLGQRGLSKATLAEAHYRLATAYKGRGDESLADLHFQRAVDMYREILSEEPDSESSIGVHYDLAMVYDARAKAGDVALAELSLRRYIELRPDEPNAYNFLGYMFVENSTNLEEAVTLIRKAVEMSPQNGAFHDSLGWAYFKLGDLDKAIVELEKAAELIPEDSEIRQHLGEVYLKLSLEKGGVFAEKAIVEWEKALELKPSAALQKRLLELRGSLEADGQGTGTRE